MRKRTISGVVILGVLIGLVGVPAFGATAPAMLVPRKLDGVYVPKGTENKWPVAVMIDNHTAARPQSGLQSASIVYETLAEGGIPRYMAVYADAASVKNIGPVRSTRPYFVRYAAELNAAMAHSGGSPDGLNLVKKLRLQSFFGIKGPFAKYFFRAFGGGVHGLYTNGAKLLTALKRAGTLRLRPLYRNWQFENGVALAQRPGGKHGATINFNYGRSYTAEYRYDRKQDRYLRFTGGRPLIDRNTRKQVTVRNIIIINTPKERVLDRKGRLDINVIGKGTGFLLKGGRVTKITWTKKSDRARTVFTNARTREEVVLTRGNTWVEIVPKGHTYKVY